MRKIADGEDYPMPATIDDPAVLNEIEEALHKIGLDGIRCGSHPLFSSPPCSI
jgi:hypothetical protein